MFYILKKWGGFARWQPACQRSFATLDRAVEVMATLQHDFPNRVFKIVELSTQPDHANVDTRKIASEQFDKLAE